MGHVWFCISCIRRLMFPSKISPSLNIPDLHPKVTYCFSEGSAVSYHTVSTSSDLNFETDTWHVALLIFRFSTACRCLAWRALSKSRKDFYVSQMGKRQSSGAGSSRKRRGKLMAQVSIYTNLVSVSFILNVRMNQPAVTQLHHLGAAELHWLFGHLLHIPCCHFPLYDVFCLHSMSCHVFEGVPLLFRFLQTQLWQMLLWTFCACWWRTSGVGCAQRTYRRPSDCSLAPSLRGRSFFQLLCWYRFAYVLIIPGLWIIQYL